VVLRASAAPAAGSLPEADLPNVIEELEGMAQNHRSALKSSYRLVIVHLLKWQYQPARRARSWEMTIVRERNNIADREEDSQTLKNEAGNLVGTSIAALLIRPRLKQSCPWNIPRRLPLLGRPIAGLGLDAGKPA
jgi:hypothetical protein